MCTVSYVFKFDGVEVWKKINKISNKNAYKGNAVKFIHFNQDFLSVNQTGVRVRCAMEKLTDQR